jgi:glycosyltransferase involved in cell wall biosynthesis
LSAEAVSGPDVAPDISVVLPTFRRLKTLSRAIVSVLSQAGPRLELIIVDDGSDDGSAEMVEALGEPRIRLIRHAVNRGAAAARNSGIAAARAPILAFIDSDDAWLPGKLAFQHGHLIRNPTLDGSTMAFWLRLANRAIDDLRCPTRNECGLPTVLDGCYVSPGSTLMVRRSAFDRAGLLNEALNRFEDWDWLLRCADVGIRLTVLSEPGAVVHLGRQPGLEQTRTATDRLWQQQEARINSWGVLASRRFQTSLLMEQLAAAVRDRNFGAALRLAAAGFTLSPDRFMRQLRRTAGHWRL